MNTLSKLPKNAQIRLRVPPTTLGDASPPNDIVGFNRRWFVHPRCLLGATLIRQGLGMSFFLGLYRRCHLLLPSGHVVQTDLAMTVLPNPLFLFTHHKFSFPFSSTEIFVHWREAGVPDTQRPPAPYEVEILDQERVRFLIGQYLKLVEEREDRRSRLYKDKADGRTWQWIAIGDGKEALFQVNSNQWAYRFIEMREFKKARQEGSELDRQSLEAYFHSLQDDPGAPACEEAGCSRGRAKFSNLCREHHFEAIMGRPWPLA